MVDGGRQELTRPYIRRFVLEAGRCEFLRARVDFLMLRRNEVAEPR
jgi:hypothetical protein